MAALLLLLIYLLAGVFIIRCLLPRQSPWARAWLGLSFGLLLLMWLPALIAFLRPFDFTAHALSLLLLALAASLAFLFRDRVPPVRFTREDRKTLVLLAAVALPLSLMGLYLQHTHVLRPQDGALFTGQATYGDLPLHLSIITSLPGKQLPAEYSILSGARLGYPFLGDSLSSSLLLLGWDLRAAVVVPGAFLMTLVFSGFLLLALRCCASRRAAVLAALFVFINGGLGFLYSVDMAGVSLGAAGNNQLQQGQWLDRLRTILYGWYQTPANHAEFTQYNLRFSNLVADMLLPQRTFLAGWAVLLPCLYLLLDMAKEGEWRVRPLILLGIMAGGLPLIHTHSFLALGLFCLGLMVFSLLKKGKIRPWLLFGGIAAVLALPQLLIFTFQQSSDGSFLRFQFNWVNNAGGNGLRDGYLWFYLKNIGLPFLLLLFALFERDAWHRKLFAGAFVIFLTAEMVLFQPNEYDNNKLFYVWWAICAMPAADYAFRLYDRLKGLRARPLMAAVAAVMMFTSGTLSIAREAVSEYQMFSQEDVRLSEFVRDETPADSRFLTGTQHINPVSALAGREIVCGPDLWLYYHGFDTRARQDDIMAFYSDPGSARGVPLKYEAGYILLGPREREMGGSREKLAALYELVYEAPEYSVYKVPEG